MKNLKVLSLLGVFCFALTANVFAAQSPAYWDFGSGYYMHITDSATGTNVVDSFYADKEGNFLTTPFLHVVMPSVGKTSVNTAWQDAEMEFVQGTSNTTKSSSIWIPLSSVSDFWAGQWTVMGDISNKTAGVFASGRVYFSGYDAPTAPEPLSMLLMLLGGAGMGVTRFLRRKTV